MAALGLLFFSACSPTDRQGVDELNSLSYAYHYRSLDSVVHYADNVSNPAFVANHLNDLAFVAIAKMDYVAADSLLSLIPYETDNQIELLIGYVQQMRLCQRRSRNKDFYDYREKALDALKRVNEERKQLSQQQTMRLLYAESELAIVTSTYYYYVGLEQQSVEALMAIDANDVRRDTAQYLNYLYNVGAGGIITEGTTEEISQREFDCLIECLLLSRQSNMPYFEANALEALAEHLINPEVRQQLIKNNLYALKYLNVDEVALDDLPLQLADEALCIFREYGDVYQTAGAYRTLAACARETGNFASTMYYLDKALADSAIFQAPDLVASIYEQLSVAHAAIDDKPNSDHYRNLYLDLQEQTRQDRLLEARAGQLDEAVGRLNLLLIGMAVLLVLILVMLRVVYAVYRRRQQRQEQLDELQEQTEETQERLAIAQLKKDENERRYLEQRAKISLVNSITPLIDRILHSIGQLSNSTIVQPSNSQIDYLRELTDRINEQNDVLTYWIQLRQGELNLQISTFPLQSIFDLIEKSHSTFAMKGITLEVQPTNLAVKADRVLTIFMLNTLADNARKFTAEGGRVRIYAEEGSDYVEVSVADTGKGMSEEELSHVFDHKVSGGHGFGLLNCKGIIEKYVKTSRLFSVCRLAAESRVGEGSRFFFRLPKGIVRLLLLLLSFSATTASSQTQAPVSDLRQQSVAVSSETTLLRASAYADSAYYANIDGRYVATIAFADSGLCYLNHFYRSQLPYGIDTLSLYSPTQSTIVEVAWLHRQLPLNYQIILRLRNEVAVAALALHEWRLYSYNNRIYTSLFKELSADRTLNDYCRRMLQLKNNMTIAVALFVFMLLALLLAVAFQLAQMLRKKAAHQQERQEQLELLTDELHRLEMETARLHVSNQVLENCLSTLKHETMYYPSRIRQLLDNGDNATLSDVARYYREIYGILSEQANAQIAGHKLYIRPLEHDIWGDRLMIDYLFDILRRQHEDKRLEATFEADGEQYIDCRVWLEGVHDVEFTASVSNIPYLLCRQIIREHGEATGRRRCGIQAEDTEKGTNITIILPRYVCKTSKSSS